MSNSCRSTVDSIRSHLGDDWKVLQHVYELLRDEKTFCVAESDKDEKIVNFVQPQELKKLIDLAIEDDASRDTTELLGICRSVIRHSVKTSHRHFHNQLFGQMDPFGLLGSWISEALNTSAYTYEVAPVFTLMETEIVRKICEVVGYDKGGDGIFSPGGSLSNMYAISLARYKRFPDVKRTGMFGMRPLVLFTSEESHYSLRKAAHWLGMGIDNCVLVQTNGRGQMLISDLEAKISRALAEGREPFFVNATAGTTVLGAFDDLQGIADVCEKYKLWMHVDGCFGGSALLSSTHRQRLLAGVERSDSFAWNPHKSLGAPLQCSLFLTREPDLLSRCNGLEVNYLFQQDKFYDVTYDTGNKSVQCGRKIDAFKLWLMLKARGLNGFGQLLDHALHMSQRLVAKLRERGPQRYRLVQDEYQFTNICFWYIPRQLRGQPETDEWRERLYSVAPKIKEGMMRCGSLMIGYSPLRYRNVGNFVRMVMTCFPIMEESDLDFMLDEIERLGEEFAC